jgi:hypothetical protein
MVICFFIGSFAWAKTVPESEIQVLRPQCWRSVASEPNLGDPANTIDSDISNYWKGTNGLMTGDTNLSAYKFNIPFGISQIDFWSLPRHESQYFMSQIDIQISINSTDGLDGEMGYQGQSAHVGNFGFYLQEIDFYREPVPVNEPATILLLGSGLIGLAGFFRKFKK